jgi:single-strand DNA-binding protein
MAKTVNKVILLGKVGKDPKSDRRQAVRLLQNLSLATSKRLKDKRGFREKEDTGRCSFCEHR